MIILLRKNEDRRAWPSSSYESSSRSASKQELTGECSHDCLTDADSGQSACCDCHFFSALAGRFDWSGMKMNQNFLKAQSIFHLDFIYRLSEIEDLREKTKKTFFFFFCFLVFILLQSLFLFFFFPAEAD